MKQKYITIPLAIAYWFLPLVIDLSGDGMNGFLIVGVMLSVGALSDFNK